MAFVVILAMLVLAGAADIVGRLFIRPDFHVSELVFGSLLGAVLVIVGVEGAARFPFIGGGR